MASYKTRQSLKTTAKFLVLAAVAGPCGTLSQPAPEASADRQQRIVERIEQEQLENGPNSAGLIEPLTDLAMFYQEEADHDLAGAAFERARQVLRVNYGLHSIEEAPLLRQLVRTEEARGNAEAAWNLQQKLLTLIRRYPNDLRIVPILREIADQRQDVLERYTAGEFPPQIILGCYYRPLRNEGCRSGSRGRVINALSSEINGYRIEALRAERWAGGCAKSPVPAIPDKKNLSWREERLVKSSVHLYLQAMADYAGCLQAWHESAARTNAPHSQLSRLEAESSAAVAEMEQVVATFEERIGSIRYSVEPVLSELAASGP